MKHDWHFFSLLLCSLVCILRHHWLIHLGQRASSPLRATPGLSSMCAAGNEDALSLIAHTASKLTQKDMKLRQKPVLVVVQGSEPWVH